MKFIKYLAVLWLTLTLAACGGGGGAPGLPSGVSTPLITSAPASLTLAVSAVNEYMISGGRTPYQVSSTNEQISVASVSNAKLTISGLASGIASIVVKDATGQSTTVSVNVENLYELYTTAPSSFTLAKDTQRIFTVGGGVAGYVAESTDTRIVAVTLSGTAMTIRGVAAGSASILIRDEANSLVTLSVTVGGDSPLGLYTSAPATLTVAKGTQSTYSVGGGVAGYTVESSDRRIATVSLSGNSMVIYAAAYGSATVTIRDAAGSTLTVDLTVASSSPGDLFTSAPSALFMGAGSSLSYVVSGGAQPYYFSSSDARVASGGISGTSLSISAFMAGSALLQIVDATGAKLQIVVTVDSPTTTATPAVSDFVLLLSKNSINNSGADSAQLSVTALDVNRNVVPDASVVVTTDQNSVFTPGGSSVTDASGKYTGTLTIGSDKTDRDITLSVTINGIVKRTKVGVSGSRLSIQASPSAPTPSQSMTVTATLIDSAGNPIPEADVTFSGTVSALQGVKLITDLKGQVSRTLLAPAAEGVYSISASGSGVNAADYPLNVFSSSVPVAIIPPGITPSLSASPNVLSVNSAGSTANQSTLRFLFLDSTNSPVTNVRVRFDDMTTGLAKVGADLIPTGSPTLYTDDSGTVSVQYVAGQNSSPTNGVTVRACYSANDFLSTTDCPAFRNVNLTTVGQALAVSIGDDNLLAVGTGGTYIKKFVVTVADSAGRAVVNAPVAIAVDLTHYGKGAYSSSYFVGTSAVNPLTVVPFDLEAAYPADNSTDPAVKPQRVWCPNEDTNRNGNVDPTENVNGSVDTNGQPTLDPRKADLIVSYADPAVTKTNSDGVLVIKVEYSQRFGTWLAYRVIATTNVSGSQGIAERLFVTDILQADATNGSFITPPYGVGSCVSPN